MKTKKNAEIWILLIISLTLVLLVMGFNGYNGDRMKLPETDMDIIDTALAAGNFTTLAAALEAAGLIEPLRQPGPYTVFAPTDEAFAELPAGTLDELLKPENRDRLAGILKHHVTKDRVVVRNWRLKTLNRDKVIINNQGTLTVNDASILIRNIPASNGVIHVIDKVLLPNDEEARRTAAKMISSAIKLGVPLYNCQNQTACATIYKSTLEDLLDLPPRVITEQYRVMIRNVLEDIKQMDHPSEIAWALRNVLDDIAENLKHQTGTMRE